MKGYCGMKWLCLLCLLLLAVTPAFAQDAGVVQVANNPTLGSILVDANGITLYTFANDAPGVSNCVAQCLELWPAYIVAADVSLTTGAGVPGVIGVITQPDGTFHITYNDAPLYYYSNDARAGDAFGQGIGDVWFAVPVVSAVPPIAELEFLLNAGVNPQLGSVLTASNGFTLYTFANDTPGVSNCVAACIELWPPFTVDAAAALTAQPGINGAITTLTRPDGLIQVLLDGRPLYFYAGDTAPGDVTGQGVGNVWFSVSLDVVRVGGTAGRNFLVDAAGKTLYFYANDEFNWSNCIGDCITNWPPLAFAAAQPVISSAGITDALITSQRADGLFHVTFNGRPLYSFVNDALPGDTNGDGAGGVWSLAAVTPIARVGGNAGLGSFAVNANGITLYTFANDTTPGSSACFDVCIANWKPVIIPTGTLPVADGYLPGTLGTLTRQDDASTQATLDGRPLYTFVNDTQPGDTNGNGLGDGAWSIVSFPDIPYEAPQTCEVTPLNATANLRQTASVNSATVRTVNQGDVLTVNGQTTSEGFIWYRLTTGEFVRIDVIAELSSCATVPTLGGDAVPAAPPPVATTQEPGAAAPPPPPVAATQEPAAVPPVATTQEPGG
jgi:predicted lipoprotein with Yx(FWY)xxD motif